MRLLIFLLFCSQISFSQADKTTTDFKVSGIVIGRDTGQVVLNYNDANNKGVFDTAAIRNGKFEFSGTVNGISDANLWTDINNISFGDQSVIRFLLEPGDISISYANGFASNALIKGSHLHDELKKWEEEKSLFIISKSKFKERADSIYQLAIIDSGQLKNLKNLIKQFDSVAINTRRIDLNFIRQHNNSYLSGFLLTKYRRQLSVDSLENYYSVLSTAVKNSNVGFIVLEYVYPLSGNIAFKKANPLNGIEFNEQLEAIESIHDLISTDTSGNKTDFKRFKGKYVLIDFWASWCKPCIAEIPYLKHIVDEFKDYPIQFISVSVDTDGKEWRKAVQHNKLSWLQVSDLKGFQGLVPTYCKINDGVPQYVLIDKNGMIVNSNTPRPGDPELKILLSNLLK